MSEEKLLKKEDVEFDNCISHIATAMGISEAREMFLECCLGRMEKAKVVRTLEWICNSPDFDEVEKLYLAYMTGIHRLRGESWHGGDR